MIIFGVEFAQRRGHSAICVATNPRRAGRNGRWEHHFLVRSLERLPVGTTFPDLASRLAEIEKGARRKAPQEGVTLYVNATGVGDPLVDFLDETLTTRVRPVYFTHGDQRSESWPRVNLGKALLVGRLQMLLQTGRLHLPKSPQTETLAQDLLDYEVQIEKDANERYGAFSVGTHDDLVTALGLAVQTDHPGLRCSSSHQVPGW